MSIKTLSLFFALIITSCASSEQQLTEVTPQTKVDIYREAQREYTRKNYPLAIGLFENFIEDNKLRQNVYVKERVFWAIDIVARIHLKINKNPTEAIAFLEGVKQDVKLNDAEEDVLLEWISVAKEWKNHGILPKKVKNKERLFALGEKYYSQGMNKLQFPGDDSAKADFYIATSYLIPYVYNFDDSKKIGEALFMLGSIRFRSWNDYEYWTENFYLKEVIRRYPHTKLSLKAYKALESGVRIGYTGSAGDFTPPSQVKMLKTFKKLATPLN